MCGIAGIIQSPGHRYTRDHLKKMSDSLAHRGPDGEGSWESTNGSVLLGHRRLSIIDLSNAGHQPMPVRSLQNEDARYHIVHNGEIYNYIELRSELEKKGYQFFSKSDTEVLVAAYDCWEQDCVDHFDGMFSFAIWDEKEKELFAARDRFGEKPFFYHFNGQELLFASEMKALWAAGIERIPNQKMLFNFITIGYSDNPSSPSETFFENIYKLPPASTLLYNANSRELELEKYWEVDPEKINKKISDQEAIDQFDHLFATSIQRRLRSDVPIGTSLSGGLDSSSIVATMASLNDPSAALNSFTARFTGFEKDESLYAQKVADQYHLHSHVIDINGEQLLEDWEKICYHQEEPFGSASIYAQYKVYERARAEKVKVLLDGQGADEILAGYTRYYKWFWQELFRNQRLYRSKELSAARNRNVNERFGVKNMIAAYFPGFATVTLENQYLLKAIRHEDLTKEFVKLQSKEAYYTIPDVFTLNGALHFNTFTHGLEELLRYADRNAMAHGREVRLPFLSHELVEFVFSLPAKFKIREGWTKWLLRKAMDKKLPDDITWRSDKVGFEPPQKKWMSAPPVQAAIQSARQKLVDHHILKPEVLQKPILPLASHAPDNYDWRYFSAASLFS